jgi:hypothetical protein
MSGSHRSLLIGINRYPRLVSAFGTPDSDLSGCVNDARAMQRILVERFGFPADLSTLLLDEAATRARILKELRALARAASPEDVVVIYYAGHGSFVQVDAPGLATGQYESLVPHDSGREQFPCLDITERELRGHLAAIAARTPYLCTIFDCCHSATPFRSSVRTRSVRPAVLNRSSTEPQHARVPNGEAGSPSEARLSPSRYVHLAACRDEEQAGEHTSFVGGERVVHGLFTHYLLRGLERARPGESYRSLSATVRAQVEHTTQAQHPQAEGALYRELFSARVADPAPLMRARVQHESMVLLDQGAVHQVEVDSVWELRALEDSDFIGTVVVDRCGLQWAHARFIKRPHALPSICAAVEVSRAARAKRIVSWNGLNSETARSLAELVAGSLNLRPYTPESVPWAEFLPCAEGGTFADCDESHSLSVLAAADSLHIRGAERVIAGPFSEREVAEMVSLLERLVHVDSLRRLENAGGRLNDEVEARLIYQPQGRARGEAPAEFDWQVAEGASVCVLQQGTPFSIEVENRTTRRVYIAVLYLDDVTGTVSTLHPPPGGAQALAPGYRGRLGHGALGCVHLPTEAELPRPLRVRAKDAAHDVLKILFSEAPIDLSSLACPAQFDAHSGDRLGGERAVIPATQEVDWCARGFAIQIQRTAPPSV